MLKIIETNSPEETWKLGYRLGEAAATLIKPSFIANTPILWEIFLSHHTSTGRICPKISSPLKF